MPAQAEWLLRVPEIRAALERIEAPVVDRAGIEKPFGVRRRRAIAMMHTLGGYQAGRTFLVERSALLARLAALEGAEDYRIEKRRRERLHSFIQASRGHLRATRIAIPIEPAAALATMKQLGPLEPRASRRCLSIKKPGMETLPDFAARAGVSEAVLCCATA